MGRMLIGFAGLMLALIVIVVIAFRWGWPTMEAWRMAPRVAFGAPPPLPGDAYDGPGLWLARPDLGQDPSHFLPPGMGHERQGRAFVFFVHPTTFMGRNGWNAPFDHADSRMRAELSVRSMASVFNDEAGVYAPRYRQAALGTFMVDGPEAHAALATAQNDVLLAFGVFLRRVPPDAPIILAGHSQGALIVLRLLRDTVRGTPLAARVMAVYLAGWPVSERHDLPQTGLTACRHTDQTGCVVGWMTFADPADPRQIVAMAARYPALDGVYSTDPPLCVNPLTGGAGAVAPASANLGSLATGDEVRRPALVQPSVGAQCDADSGLLLVSDPPHLGDAVMAGNNYSAYDFALFWRNLRSDLARRETAWLRHHPLS